MRVVDLANGEQLPPGRSGEIQLRGRNLMRGICGRAREDVFTADGFYPTGDIGFVDADGYLFFSGRRDDMFKVKGATVSPSEVEAALHAVPDVERAVVVDLGAPPNVRVGALVVLAPGSGATVEDLAREAAARLERVQSSDGMGDRRRRQPAGDGDRQDRQGRRAATPGAHVTDAPPPAPAMGAPLDGIRVLDLSQVVSGPICGRMLADLGADVVKLEPGSGDVIRMLEPHVGDPPVSVYFTWANAGKRSISVDLREPRGAELVRQLAVTSDVVLENFRPGVMEKFGLDADTLLAVQPALVYCSVNGWGLANSWSQRRAYAAMVQAEVGRVELDARLRNAPPEQSPHVDGDITPGLLAVSAVLAALFQRERTGRGQHLDVSLAEALVYTDEWTTTELAGFDGDRIPDTWNYPIFTVADGTAAAFMGDPHRRLPEVAAALTDVPVDYTDSRDEAMRILRDLCAQVPDFATLEARFDLFGFLVGEVRTVAQLAETPWARERGVFTEVEPGVRVSAAPFRSLQSTIGVRGPAPRFAEHTRAVLAERLQLSDDTLDVLEVDGVIATPRRGAPSLIRIAFACDRRGNQDVGDGSAGRR